MGLLETAAGQIDKLSGKQKELKYKHFAEVALKRVDSLSSEDPSQIIVKFRRNKHIGYPGSFFKGVIRAMAEAPDGLELDISASLEASQEQKIVGMNYRPSSVWREDYISFVFNQVQVKRVPLLSLVQPIELPVLAEESQEFRRAA